MMQWSDAARAALLGASRSTDVSAEEIARTLAAVAVAKKAAEHVSPRGQVLEPAPDLGQSEGRSRAVTAIVLMAMLKHPSKVAYMIDQLRQYELSVPRRVLPLALRQPSDKAALFKEVLGERGRWLAGHMGLTAQFERTEDLGSRALFELPTVKEQWQVFPAVAVSEPDEAAAWLVQRWKDLSASHRAQAVSDLWRASAEVYPDVLELAKQDSSREVRLAVIRLLVRMGDVETLEQADEGVKRALLKEGGGLWQPNRAAPLDPGDWTVCGLKPVRQSKNRDLAAVALSNLSVLPPSRTEQLLGAIETWVPFIRDARNQGMAYDALLVASHFHHEPATARLILSGWVRHGWNLGDQEKDWSVFSNEELDTLLQEGMRRTEHRHLLERCLELGDQVPAWSKKATQVYLDRLGYLVHLGTAKEDVRLMHSFVGRFHPEVLPEIAQVMDDVAIRYSNNVLNTFREMLQLRLAFDAKLKS